jgi:hypothetical protein
MTILKSYLNYIKDNPKKLWFKAKWYGWGWTPVSWKGWLVTTAYVGLMIISANLLVQSSPKEEIDTTFVLTAIILTLIFLYIAYKKGEKPHWSWGGPKTG